MDKYGWILKIKEIHVYSVFHKNEGLLKYKITNLKKSRKSGIEGLWAFDENHKYKVTFLIKNNILYTNSIRIGSDYNKEEAKAIFKLPTTKTFHLIWGVGMGIVDGIPMSNQVLLSKNELAIEEAEKKFVLMGYAPDETLTVIDHEPNYLNNYDENKNDSPYRTKNPNDWILKKTIYIHHWVLGSNEIKAYEAQIIRNPKSDNNFLCIWKYDIDYKYKGFLSINDGIMFVRTQNQNETDYVMSMFKLPKNRRFNVVWGVAVGLMRGEPVANRTFISHHKFSPKEALKEYDKKGYDKKKSFLMPPKNPDEGNQIEDIKISDSDFNNIVSIAKKIIDEEKN